MPTRFRLFSLGGVPFYAQESFLWLLGLIVLLLVTIPDGGPLSGEKILALAFTLVAVLVHEYGHALCAKRLGITVVDVSIHFFYGMARMEPPRTPREELLVGLAGPASNLAIAVLSFPFARSESQWQGLIPTAPMSTLFAINFVLGAVNLLPAFPMDGGRLFRALLSLRLGGIAATRCAVALGRFLGLMLVFSPLVLGFPLWSLAFPVMGGVILFLGESEWQRVSMQAEERRVASLVKRERASPSLDSERVVGPGSSERQDPASDVGEDAQPPPTPGE